jgi:4-amino-4-deoxy-L-arabinose transferase-like glycosyltransferase
LGLAAVLRFYQLEQNPGWYTDEGTHLEIAKHLQHGRWQYLVINQSTLLFAKLPLFELLLAGCVRLFGLTMFTLRGLTAGCGVLSVALLYGVMRDWVGEKSWLPLLSALVLAVYPQAVLYHRLGFSYNLLTPLLLLTLWGVQRWLTSGRVGFLLLACCATGLGITTDLAMVSTALWLVGVVAWRNWRLLPPAGLLMALPFGLYILWGWLTIPEAFWFDLAFTLSRLGGKGVAEQLWLLASNYTILLAQDSWLVLGMMGLWLFPRHPGRMLLLLAWFVPLLMLGRTVPLYELTFYYILWLLPLVAVGVAVVLEQGCQWLSQQIPGRVSFILLLLVLGVPLMMSTYLTFGRVQTHFGTVIDPFLLNPASAQAVMDYVNQHSQPTDLVIASPGLAWGLHSQAADMQLMVKAAGFDTPHLPTTIPSARFTQQPHLSQAKFVIVDNLWRNWGLFHLPGLAEQMAQIEEWPVVFSAGEIVVYQRKNEE